ncbi:hypothetical protein Lal_00022605 [Lupinus albus]|nr:hypothetical protein Lal_00038593 [Lupinus albus]KAF1895108.1 hypothetical protein Lal_00022605 [Lupinus albus]
MDSKTLNQSPPFIRFYSLRFRSGDRLTTMEARNFDVVYAVASFVQLSVLKLVEAVEPLAAWALGNNLAPMFFSAPPSVFLFSIKIVVSSLLFSVFAIASCLASQDQVAQN